MAVTTDGRLAISGSDDGLLKIWDLKRGKALAVIEGHRAAVRAVAMTADGRIAISGSSDATLKVWDLRRQLTLAVLEGHSDRVTAVALTADGRLAVSGSADKKVMVWDVERGTALATFTAEQGVNAVATVSDQLFVAGDAGGRLHLLELVLPTA